LFTEFSIIMSDEERKSDQRLHHCGSPTAGEPKVRRAVGGNGKDQ